MFHCITDIVANGLRNIAVVISILDENNNGKKTFISWRPFQISHDSDSDSSMCFIVFLNTENR